MRNVVSGSARATASMRGLVVAVGSAVAAYQTFNATVGEAARYELSQFQIEGMLKDADKAAAYMENVRKKAFSSPIIHEAEMLAYSKGFIGQSHDLDTLQKMWDVTEKLVAYDPIQGIDGATFALREIFSGDGLSMSERFEIPKDVVNDIKKMDVADQLVALDDYLIKIGISQEYLDKIGTSNIVLWDKFKARLKTAMRSVGEGSLEVLRPMLRDMNEFMDSGKWRPFTDMLSRGLADAFGWAHEKAKLLYGYIDRNYLNNPEFLNLSFGDKVREIMSDVERVFNRWYQNDGKEMIRNAASSLISTLSESVRASLPTIVSVGVDVGKALAQGMLDGLKGAAEQNPELAALLTFLATPGPAAVKLGAAATVYGGSSITGAIHRREEADRVAREEQKSFYQKLENAKPGESVFGDGVLMAAPPDDRSFFERQWGAFTNNPFGLGSARDAAKNAIDWTAGRVSGSYASGLSRVPYNGYIARLHKDERVLTPEENREYSRTGGNGGINIAKIADQVVIREDADIDRIAAAFVRKVKEAQMLGAASAGY
ncbi:hypothetical protein [Marinicrinis sediminis]|uniref:Pre-toxin TG domain-containing protein n=1 Tax=Marinicrinis sediminis TaxID=1652465 RepID=A0ABW5RDA1_9BACL